MRVAVASGKGGTGKTLVATNLAWELAGRGMDVAYVDADVEEPNGHLFFKPEWESEQRLTVDVPALRNATCSGRGVCQETCAFHAIMSLKDRVLVFPELCHSCGACIISCPEQALVASPLEVGTIRSGHSGLLPFFDGILDVGEARSTPLITSVVSRLNNGVLGIVDAPPGTSCPAMISVRGADLVLLVTEPTPFGLHDLELAVGMCREMGLEVASVINRADVGNNDVRDYLDQQNIPVFAEIPFDREVATAASRGALAASEVPGFRKKVNQIADRVIAALDGA